MKKVFYLACLPVLLTASSTAELPENNRLMYNKHASGYVEVKFNRSTRFESLRTLKPERTLIQSIQTAYFSAGAWNIHSLPQKNEKITEAPRSLGDSFLFPFSRKRCEFFFDRGESFISADEIVMRLFHFGKKI